ncbi:tripartite tricarboxylate transporter substrate binding protein [Tardiphaga sp. vice352]|uniref:Bug family tripartite tricarboxylate transporter substrate binding protein n=1 Tax=unclassified Tardiphaga TaxID=2631404 RepID=UPI0011622820|nr:MULTISPECIES: tripartite tricarboxylate transporter substrate binding protein [unclassified Tardiphaga]MBC7585950.1 tripartite tricarboxylate transporter substrate binding protein [Tardiphaga sp.]QDM18062.1 tripartite tricarboxylate transporter substrate binding protein [Tardiphaga sp. vice278]QDM23102.1 tripartite tricarboxylate transporter substrate binding protein [Tardiphaga sp. vice154]QDM33410.1 tripartite tricarboxylate transporter substrate binding protein [Tardiphaga sp. vice352]
MINREDNMRAGSIAALLCLVLASPVTIAGASDEASGYPNRPIRLVVGFTAGGGNDIIARVVGQRLSESLGQPVIVENKPGAGAVIATEFVARSAPDGYTLLIGASGAMVINPAVYEKLNYDTLRDFAPISELGSFPLMLIVKASSPFKSVADLVTYAKANPGKANYSSSSAAFQLATELFKQKTGAPMQMIPYKGANESVTAVIAGDVMASIADAGPVMGQVTGGEARALAVAAPKRIAELPDVPTMKEAGVDFEAVLWSGVFAPKATPPAIVKKLQDEFVRIARMPDVVARLKILSIDSVGSTSAEFTRIIAADIDRWVAVARAGNIRLTQ